jgi:hypothetical protein
VAATVVGIALLVGAVLGWTRNDQLLAWLAQTVAWHLVCDYRATALEVVLALGGGLLGAVIVGVLGTVVPNARRA